MDNNYNLLFFLMNPLLMIFSILNIRIIRIIRLSWIILTNIMINHEINYYFRGFG